MFSLPVQTWGLSALNIGEIMDPLVLVVMVIVLDVLPVQKGQELGAGQRLQILKSLVQVQQEWEHLNLGVCKNENIPVGKPKTTLQPQQPLVRAP